jgi:hypothetical protein
MTGFEAFANGVYQAPVFVVEEAALTGGEDEDFSSRVSEGQEFHVPAEIVTEPLVILALQLIPE